MEYDVFVEFSKGDIKALPDTIKLNFPHVLGPMLSISCVSFFKPLKSFYEVRITSHFTDEHPDMEASSRAQSGS